MGVARLLNVVGIFVVLAIATLFSRHRKLINVRLVCNALALQCAIAFFVLKTSIGQWFVGTLATGVAVLYEYAREGIQFVFGALGTTGEPWGFIFALHVLPVMIFFGALTGLLFHLGVIQFFVAGINAVLRPILGTSGPETLCAIGNSFLGPTEAPLLIRHYLADMSRSELLVVMVSGMGTISGSILTVYAVMGVPAIHLLSASVMAIPATILIAKILLPETELIKQKTVFEYEVEVAVRKDGNFLGAISSGTIDGLQLALNVGAMLIAFISLIALLNGVLGFLCGVLHFPAISLQMIVGWIFAPFGFLLGLPSNEIFLAGQLIGTKVAVNEMVAFSDMVTMELSDRSMALLTYALCGFSNFSCIGIQIGGIGALVPEKRSQLAELGLYALLGGTLSNLLSACIAGLFL